MIVILVVFLFLLLFIFFFSEACHVRLSFFFLCFTLALPIFFFLFDSRGFGVLLDDVLQATSAFPPRKSITEGARLYSRPRTDGCLFFFFSVVQVLVFHSSLFVFSLSRLSFSFFFSILHQPLKDANGAAS